MQKEQAILVCGASARAVVEMARSTHQNCLAIDLFNDWDTQELAHTAFQIPRLCDAQKIARRLDYRECILTGGMEHHLRTVARLCHRLPCRDLESLRRCRDPFELAKIVRQSPQLAQSQVAFPETTRKLPANFRQREWLIKPVHRAGGLGVRDMCRSGESLQPSEVFQQKQSGQPVSGLYLGDGSKCRLLGTSYMWVGNPKLGSSGYRYCGSISPGPGGEREREGMRVLGDVLVKEFGLRGVFGIDFIVGSEAIWFLEVHPRFPASAEVVQPQLAFSLVEAHLRAVDGVDVDSQWPTDELGGRTDRQVFGKAVVFNRFSASICLTQAQHGDLVERFRTGVENGNANREIETRISDIPRADSLIEPGQPVLTVRTTQQKKSAVEAELIRHAESVFEFLKRANAWTNPPVARCD